MKVENKQLKAVYNGNETIINAGFTMQSNYVLPVLARMVNEGLMLQKGADVVQAILSFKHTEENPFPSTKTIALYLGKGEDYVKQALKTIKKAGILPIKKAGRRNTYDFSVFFTLIEKFIVEFKEKKNHAVKIADLMNFDVQEKEEKDFSWAERYKGNEKPQEAPREDTEEANTKLPNELLNVLEAYSISPEGVKAVEQSYIAYSSKLADTIFVAKIVASKDKKDFVKYYETCISKAYLTGEQPQEAPAPKQYKGKQAPVRTEMLPEWFGEYENESKLAEEKRKAEVEEVKSKEAKKAELKAKLKALKNMDKEGVQ